MAGPFGETINVDIGDPVCVSCLTTWGYAKPPRIGDSSGTYELKEKATLSGRRQLRA